MTASLWNPNTALSPVLPAVAPVQFVKGTALLPGITFVGDTDTGIWSEADGTVNITCNGVTRLTIKPDGDVIVNGKYVNGTELDIASSTVCDIGSLASNSARVTGTNGITSFGTNYSGPMFLRFAGALTLANSATLVLPGGTNISVTAGDSCVAIPKATAGVPDGWVVIAFQRSSSATSGGGATGAAGNYIFFENDQIVTGDYTLSTGKNAVSAGPVTIADTIVVTVPTGATWTVV